MIQSVQGVYNELINATKSNHTTKTSDVVFESALQSAKELLQATQQADDTAAELTYAFLTGENEDIHGLMIAQEKASILLQFTMQVRNQVMSAYSEIMRITV